MAKPTLVDVKGIGSITAEKLSAAGIKSVEAILKASPQKIGEVTGFDTNRVEKILAAAAESLKDSNVGGAPKTAQVPAPVAETQKVQETSSQKEETGKKSKAKEETKKTKDSGKKKEKDKKKGGKKAKKKGKKDGSGKKKSRKKKDKKKKK